MENIKVKENFYIKDGVEYRRVTDLIKEHIFDITTFVPKDTLNRAATFGKAVHLACEFYDKGILKWDTLNSHLRPYVDQYVKFQTEHYYYEIKAIEQTLVSNMFLIGGTPDRLLFDNRSGKYCILDIKTSTDFSPTWGIQLNLYKVLYEEFGIKIKDLFTLQLFEDYYEIMPINHVEDKIVTMNLLNVHTWKLRNL